MLKALFAAASAIALTGCIYIETTRAPSDGASRPKALHNAQSLSGGDIDVTLQEEGDFSISGGDVRVNGEIGGELAVSSGDFVADGLVAGALEVNAGDVVFDGEVAGPVTVNAADVRWDGDITGPARFNAADLSFEGAVNGPLIANIADGAFSGRFDALRINAADVAVRDGSVINARFEANVSDLDFGGRALGAFDVAGRTVILTGIVEGPVIINADPGRPPHRRNDGRVEISGAIGGGYICGRIVELTGEIGGPLEVVADEAPALAGAAVSADITYTARQGRCDRD